MTGRDRRPFICEKHSVLYIVAHGNKPLGAFAVKATIIASLALPIASERAFVRIFADHTVGV
jgi:hypothetical protein